MTRTTDSRHRPIPFLALLLAAATICGCPPTQALAATFPAHRLGAVACVDGGVMKVNPPASMAPTVPTDLQNAEEVLWRPKLQRQDGRVWRPVATGPRFRAFTSSDGFFQAQFQTAWQYVATNAPVFFYPFRGLGPGTYRVKHYLWWSWHPSRVWHVHRQGRCRFA